MAATIRRKELKLIDIPNIAPCVVCNVATGTSCRTSDKYDESSLRTTPHLERQIAAVIACFGFGAHQRIANTKRIGGFEEKTLDRYERVVCKGCTPEDELSDTDIAIGLCMDCKEAAQESAKRAQADAAADGFCGLKGLNVGILPTNKGTGLYA